MLDEKDQQGCRHARRIKLTAEASCGIPKPVFSIGSTLTERRFTRKPTVQLNQLRHQSQQREQLYWPCC